MDIKDLNKSQMILLAVLISFVTSIATGITTVTLMQQAPDSVTVPINRVIQQTVEKIQQVEGKTTLQTVIVKEEDLVVDAIAKNKSAVFTVTKKALDQEGNDTEVSAGQGFAVNSDGIIVTDAVFVPNDDVYYMENASGKFKTKFVSTDPKGFSFLRATDPIGLESKFAATPPTFGDISKIKVGQKIIVLGSTISSFIFDGDKEIKINVNKSTAGGMVFDLNGDALGIALFSDTTPFASIDAIKTSLDLVPKP